MRDLSETVRGAMASEDRLRFSLDPSWFFIQHVTGQVQKYMHAVDPWTPERFDEETTEVIAALRRIPIPAGPWLGPIHDPWLQSWDRVSPLQACGLAALAAHPEADHMFASPEFIEVVNALATSEEPWVARMASEVASRLEENATWD
jgi:hypothetical protein